MVLGLPVDSAFAASEAMQSARPFGRDGPDFATLNTPSVSLAMALVPLTPEDGGGKPILVRLYCAKGLAVSFTSPFKEGVDSPGFAGVSWFVAGLPDKIAGESVNGRSWLLAAHLLKAVLDRNLTASTKKNLATSFIVTGDVENGSIRLVEMGRKPELASIKEYRNLKWIIPMKNINDMNNVPSRLVEKPATLEEAYELIESMQSRATKSFFRFLKAADIDGMKEQYANGADLFALDVKSGKMAIELVGEEIHSMVGKIGGECEQSVRLKTAKALEKFNQAKAWLKQCGADCAGLFFLLARYGMGKELVSCANVLPINARDEDGLTALDMALNGGHWDAARLLHSLGGTFDTTATRNKQLASAIQEAPCVSSRMELVKLALSMGLDPDAQQLFGNCIRFGDAQLVEACLEAGRDPNKEIGYLRRGVKILPVLVVAEDVDGIWGERGQEALIAMFEKYGLCITPELEREITRAKARSVVHRGETERIVLALEKGWLSFEDEFMIGLTDNPNLGALPINGSLFALALDRGWVDVIAKCLEKGASIFAEIKTTYWDWDASRKEGCNIVYEQGKPIDYIESQKRALSPEKKHEVLTLLESELSKCFPPQDHSEDFA